MKNKIIFFSLFLFFSLTSFANITKSNRAFVDTLPTDQLIPYLEQMNLTAFYGKPIDSFLVAVPANFYNMKVFGGENSQGAIFRANCMIVDFTSTRATPGVVIHVREFTHVNRYSPTATWDVNLFRKEKIYKIEIWRDQNTCINGDCLE